MNSTIREALLWTVAFVAIGIVIAVGARIVGWVVDGETENVWRAALLLIGSAAGGGRAVTAIRSKIESDNESGGG